ncbi:MAG: methyltransferase domain-containing protein [Chloroflexota bacterium]
MDGQPQALPFDYDDNPDRFRTGRRIVLQYGTSGDVHEPIAARLAAEGLAPVLDIGCGDGALGRPLLQLGVPWVGLDFSATLLRDAPRPAVRADATRLPFPDGSFGAVAALYMLYHLADPALAIAEAHRVLRPGGLLVTAAPSRYDSPELQHLLPPEPPSTFDAELAPDLLRQCGFAVEIDAWDGPYIKLPNAEALRAYLTGRTVEPALAARVVTLMSFPLSITKRGAIVYGRKPGAVVYGRKPAAVD